MSGLARLAPSSHAYHAWRRFGLWARLVCAAVTLVVIALPTALGSALEPVLHGIAEARGHACKCGMPAGKCGCPECVHLEQVRLREHRSTRLPALKRHCDDDAPPMPLGAALPAGVLAATSGASLSAPRGDRIPVGASVSCKTFTSDEPPTPPPRSASV